ncbi:Calpain-2 Catalytic Subunit [Manis pentadactyla]|nr:Calpain-2 Catalytic Subunit [Manis pentadactyla]
MKAAGEGEMKQRSALKNESRQKGGIFSETAFPRTPEKCETDEVAKHSEACCSRVVELGTLLPVEEQLGPPLIWGLSNPESTKPREPELGAAGSLNLGYHVY